MSVRRDKNDKRWMRWFIGVVSPETREHQLLLGILLVGLLHGLLYIFLMPPWQHYEEPSHFEYTWLIASEHELPEYPAYDQAKRREIAASMIEHGFFYGMGWQPNLLLSPENSVWIGINVTGALPLYHLFVALPLSMIPHAAVETQLYLSRFLSLALYLGTIGISYLVMREFFQEGHILRLGVPMGLALLPGFVELMTAVNNDVGATFVFSLFLWLSLRLILRGVSVRRVLFAGVTAGLCLLTKTTILVAGPLLLLALVFAVLRKRWRPIFWLIPVLIALVGAATSLNWGDAAFWYRSTKQQVPTSVTSADVPCGRSAFRLQITSEHPVAEVRQPLLSDVVEDIGGETLSAGVWLWASEPTEAQLIIATDESEISYMTEVGTEPDFHAFHADVPESTRHIWVILQNNSPVELHDGPISLYGDGFILAEGYYSLDMLPTFETAHGKRGMWGERDFINLVRNPSAETRWLFIAPWLERVRQRYPWAAHLNLSTLLASLMDWQYTNWLYEASIANIVETFWARFGWGHVRLSSSWWYKGLYGLSALSMWGIISIFWYTWDKSQSWRLAMFWFGIAGVVIWGEVIVRGFVTLASSDPFIPSARYGYPAIIPTLFFLFVGWGWLLKNMKVRKGLVGATLWGFLVLDVVSIFTVWHFYVGR